MQVEKNKKPRKHRGNGNKKTAVKDNKNTDFGVVDGGIVKRRRKRYSTFNPNQEIKKAIKAAGIIDQPRSKMWRNYGTRSKASETIAQQKKNDTKWIYRKGDYTKTLKPYPVPHEKLERYSRGEGINVKDIKHRFFRKRVQNKEKKINYAVEQAARTEYLLLEKTGFVEPEGYEETWQFTQKEIRNTTDITSATKHFELNLDFGPYRLDYTRHGRHLVLGGRRGHVAAFDWVTKHLLCEINVMETIHDIKWLHVETMFAVAQKSWVYIYDNQGTELHCIKQLHNVLRLEFLPYHFLLAASTESGHLAWLDVSIGKLISKFHARMGRLPHMTHNPYNGTLVLGHPTGVVTMWSPNVKEPLAKMLCQKTAIQAIAIDPNGRYVATSAMDRSVNIWDIRAMKALQSYRMNGVASSLQLSQRCCLATAVGNIVQVYRECIETPADAPYLRFKGNQGSATHLQFCPYEDVLGVAMERGFSSLIIPGSGEPNFDALEQNPMRSKQQRREGEVRALLEKVQPEFITLDPLEVTEVDVPSLRDKVEAQKALMSLKVPKIDFQPRRRNKKGGGLKNARTKKILQQQAQKEFISLTSQAKEKLTLLAPEANTESERPKEPASVLDRFKPKSKK